MPQEESTCGIFVPTWTPLAEPRGGTMMGRCAAFKEGMLERRCECDMGWRSYSTEDLQVELNMGSSERISQRLMALKK